MDKYDAAIEYCKQHPDEIEHIWGNPDSSPHGCLFNYCTREGMGRSHMYGCLTMIRSDFVNDEYNPYDSDNLYKSAFGEEHTKKIRLDKRIPLEWKGINESNLHVFAEYQREMDAMAGVQ